MAGRPKSAVTSPLIKALIATIPPATETWPEEKQFAWLHLMALAFGSIYGGHAAERLSGAITPMPQPKTPTVATPGKVYEFEFYVDPSGMARAGSGVRIMPEDVTGNLVDMRPDGEASEIIWADGSMGVANAGSLMIVSPED